MSVFRFSKLSKRPGATVAGMGGVALSCVLLLCGAGSAPIENLLPQGAMQGDLNAGGHSLTNAASVQTTNAFVNTLVVTNSFSAPASFTSGFEPALGNPGTDGYVLSSTAAGVRSWIAAGGGGSLSLGSNASAVMSLSSGTLDLQNGVNTSSGLLQIDATGAIPISLINNLSTTTGLNGLFFQDGNGSFIDLTGNAALPSSSIEIVNLTDNSQISITGTGGADTGSVLQIGATTNRVLFDVGYDDSNRFTLGSVGASIVAPAVGGPSLYLAYNPMTSVGDLSYGGTVSNCYSLYGSLPVAAPTRLAGNTSTVAMVLTSTGSGSAATAPAWKAPFASSAAPASSSASGTAGQIAYDSTYFYICTATNTWKRASLSSF